MSALVFSGVVGGVRSVDAASASPFVDIAPDYEFMKALSFLKERGAIRGYPDQTFRTDMPVTRAEFLKMALRLGGKISDEQANAMVKSTTGTAAGGTTTAVTATAKSSFIDVATTDWFYPYITTGVKLGVVKGYSNGRFLPYGKVTRSEALKIAFLALDLGSTRASGSSDVLPLDVSATSWFAPYVSTARRNGIMLESDDGLFRPMEGMIRGTSSELLYRVAEVRHTGQTFDQSFEWPVREQRGLTFRMPASWRLVSLDDRLIVWKRDPREAGNNDYEIITGLAAKIIFRYPTDESATSASAYNTKMRQFSKQAFHADDMKFSDVTVAGKPTLHVLVPSAGVENWYIYLGGQRAMTVYAQYGIGSMTPVLRDRVRAMVRTLSVAANAGGGVSGGAAGAGGVTISTETSGGGMVSSALSKLKSDVLGAVLHDHAGKAAIDSIGDALIFETDAIGVGTGAVDYYFSAKLNLTLKYERASDTILAVRTGKTSGF